MKRRIPTVNVAVAMTVPTIHRMSLDSRFAILPRKTLVEVRDLSSHRREAGLKLIQGDVVALFDTVLERLGDDFGLVAGDGERVEHVVRVARAAEAR